MALWKPFLGNRTKLDSVEKHAGYVYWCVDDSTVHFDFEDADGNLQRRQVNAESITGLLESSRVVHGDGQELLSALIENYILTIDYENLLAFDTSEVVFDVNTNPDINAGTSAVLGVAILGQMVLG